MRREEGTAREADDILITSGCQQAFDLLQRTLCRTGETVVIEDPVHPGARNVFRARAGAWLIGVPVGAGRHRSRPVGPRAGHGAPCGWWW